VAVLVDEDPPEEAEHQGGVVGAQQSPGGILPT